MTQSAIPGSDTDGQKGPPALTPTFFETAIVRCPCLCCWAWFGFAMLFFMVMNVMIGGGSLNFDANGVWDVRNSEMQTQFDAFIQGREAYATDEDDLSNYLPRSQPMVPVHMVFFSESGNNLLTKDTLAWVRRTEEKVMKAVGVQEHCLLSSGADMTVAAVDFASLDPTADKVTFTGTAPANETELLFRGVSSVLIDGGKYVALGASSGYGLYLRDSQLRYSKVDFAAANDITSGKFFTVTQRCASMQSLSNYAFPARQGQKDAICSAFVASASQTAPSGEYVTVVAKICGCNSSSPVYSSNSSACSTDCTNNFGTSGQCTSPSYVEGPTADAESDVMNRLVKFCPGFAGLTSAEETAYKGMRKQLLPTTFACTTTSDMTATKSIRSVMWVGGPVEGYTKVAGSSINDQVNKLMTWSQGTTNSMMQPNGDGFLDAVTAIENEANAEQEGTARVVIMGSFLLQAAYFKLMAVEGLYAMGSIWFVWMWVWCATGSALLATCCIFETIISLPMAMATWGLFGQKYVGFLCVMMVFVILGIGADDVFVLYDAWKQSGQLGFADDEEGTAKRFSWALRRAGGAMTVTTATTIFCFIAAGFADVPTISGFGFFAALVVWWDFFLVMTFFASALMVYHYHFERRNLCCGHMACTGHMLCCPCSCIMYDSETSLWKQWKISVPFGLLLLLGIASIVANQLVFGGILVCTAAVYIHAQVSSSVTEDSKPRPIESFCENTLYPLLQRNARKFMATFALLVVVAGVLVGVGLRLPAENQKFLNEKNPIQKYLDSTADYAVGGDAMLETLNVVFGMNKAQALDRSGVDYQQPGSSWGKPVPDEPLGVINFDDGAKNTLFSSAGQTEVVEICDGMRQEPDIANSDASCELVVYEGLAYPRHITNPAALESSGVIAKASNVGVPYYVVQPGKPLTDAGDGFCNTGVYCFMYDVRNYIMHFCDPASGLKAQMVNVGGSEYEDLCKDNAGNVLPQTFPAPDLEKILISRGYKLYHTKVSRKSMIMNGMAYADYANSRNTGVGLKDNQFKFAWVGINASFPKGVLPHSEQVENYERFDSYFKSKISVNSEAFMVAYQFNWMNTVSALLRNTIQSVIIAVVFCWFVLVGTTWNIVVGSLAVCAVVCVVAGAGGMMVIIGWHLGIIESIACIVIIGISVDYSVHIAHAYNVAVPPESASTRIEQCEAKAKNALGTIGISLVSGCVTSLGATLFLMFCQINFFRMFGQFLFLTLVISFLVAFLFLIPTLIVLGPGKGQGKLPRFPCGGKAESSNNEISPTTG